MTSILITSYSIRRVFPMNRDLRFASTSILAPGGLLIVRSLGDFVVLFLWVLGVLSVWIGPWRTFDFGGFDGLNGIATE